MRHANRSKFSDKVEVCWSCRDKDIKNTSITIIQNIEKPKGWPNNFSCRPISFKAGVRHMSNKKCSVIKYIMLIFIGIEALAIKVRSLFYEMTVLSSIEPFCS